MREQSESIDCGCPGKRSTLSAQPRFRSKIDNTPSCVPTTTLVPLIHVPQFYFSLRSKSKYIPSCSDDTQQLVLLILAPRHGGGFVRADVEHGQCTVPARRDQMLLIRKPEEIRDEVGMVSIRPYFGLV